MTLALYGSHRFGKRHRCIEEGRNGLTIRVANLWPNRMIGDSTLPVTERLTWSSYEPFTKDTPLLKSGLLGPVTVETAETIALP